MIVITIIVMQIQIMKTIQSNTNDDDWREPVVRLRGLPYNSSKEDVTRFFRRYVQVNLIKE